MGHDQRIYRAEDCMRALHGDRRMETIAEVRKYVRDLVAQDWFRRRWPQEMRFRVRDGRGAYYAYCSSADGRSFALCFPRATRTEYFVLHEVAHACTWASAQIDHGQSFRDAVLLLVRRRMGRNAAELLRNEWRTAGLAA
jgi:putative metallohydrolase (TIGR04338 family)